MFYDCESLTSIPDLDMDSATNLNSTFQLTGITKVPKINTRNVTNMGYVLGGCTGITEIPDWDFSKVETMQYAFYNTSIETADINLPKATELMSTFAYCRKLKSVNFTAPELKGIQMTFNGSTNLESIGPIDASNFTYLVNMFNSNMTKLVNFGGMQNLKIDWNDNNGLKRCPNLTYESLMNVINGLYDFVGNGEVGGKTLLLSTASQSKLSDADIEIATNKG